MIRTRRHPWLFALLVALLASSLVFEPVFAAAGTTLTVRGLRATLDAKQLSQAKNLVNEQVEQMRGLPYFVANTTSTASVDVLDRFFPNLTQAGAPTCSADAATWIANKSAWSGFVSGGARCPFEPANGAFYRTVVDPSVSGASPTAVVVATQFLGLASGTGADAPSITPPTGYAWDATGLDTPASAQIAAHVTAVYGPPGATAKYTTSRTDIADRRAGPPLVSAETNGAAVVVDGSLATGGSQRLELGTVEEWTAWLREHHEQPQGVWLVSPRKASERAFSYEEAVIEALRFGWVDSTAKPVDERRSMQWFAPRRAGSMWTRINKGRALYTRPDRLGEYLLVDYLARKRRRV